MRIYTKCSFDGETLENELNYFNFDLVLQNNFQDDLTDCVEIISQTVKSPEIDWALY
jgi:hypothetical protein